MDDAVAGLVEFSLVSEHLLEFSSSHVGELVDGHGVTSVVHHVVVHDSVIGL